MKIIIMIKTRSPARNELTAMSAMPYWIQQDEFVPAGQICTNIEEWSHIISIIRNNGVFTITVFDPENDNAIIILMNGIGDGISSIYTVYRRILRALAKYTGMHR